MNKVAIPPTENPNPILKRCCQRWDVPTDDRYRLCRPWEHHWIATSSPHRPRRAPASARTTPSRSCPYTGRLLRRGTGVYASQQRKARRLIGSTVTHREVIIDSKSSFSLMTSYVLRTLYKLLKSLKRSHGYICVRPILQRIFMHGRDIRPTYSLLY